MYQIQLYSLGDLVISHLEGVVLIRFNIIIFVLLIKFSIPAWADGDYSIANFSEHFSQKVSVSSGPIRSGVMFGSESKYVDLNQLYLYIPETVDVSKKILCADITSIDGNYYAKFKLSVKSGVTGAIKLILSSKYNNELMDYSILEVAVAVTIRETCDRPSKIEGYVPTSWGVSSQKKTRVLINSGAQKTSFKFKKTQSQLACNKIYTEKSKIAYDVLCEFASSKKASRILVLRKDYGSRLKTVFISIIGD